MLAGSINATVHREVIREHAAHFSAGTVIVLRQASTSLHVHVMFYCLSVSHCVLYITVLWPHFN